MIESNLEDFFSSCKSCPYHTQFFSEVEKSTADFSRRRCATGIRLQRLELQSLDFFFMSDDRWKMKLAEAKNEEEREEK